MNTTYKHSALLLITSILVLLPGCLEFESIEQPSSVLPGELFTIRITVTADGEFVEPPYFGICLPLGWTIPGDAITCTGVYQGTIRYDPNLSLEQENLRTCMKTSHLADNKRHGDNQIPIGSHG